MSKNAKKTEKVDQDVTADPTIVSLAVFMARSQAAMSIALAMPGSERLADAWRDVRLKLGLNGWHSEDEALAAIRQRLAPVCSRLHR